MDLVLKLTNFLKNPELPLFLQWSKQIPIPHDIAGFHLINLKIQMTINHWEVQNTLVLQWSGSPGYEPSSVTCHEPIVMTISTSCAKVHNPKGTHSQIDLTYGSKQRSSSSESGHETSVMDSMKKKKKKKKHKKRRSPDRSPVPKAISFSMHQPQD